MRVKTRKLKASAPIKNKTIVTDADKFPIVGIGASAGGLEALEDLKTAP